MKRKIWWRYVFIPAQFWWMPSAIDPWPADLKPFPRCYRTDRTWTRRRRRGRPRKSVPWSVSIFSTIRPWQPKELWFLLVAVLMTSRFRLLKLPRLSSRTPRNRRRQTDNPINYKQMIPIKVNLFIKMEKITFKKTWCDITFWIIFSESEPIKALKLELVQWFPKSTLWSERSAQVVRQRQYKLIFCALQST